MPRDMQQWLPVIRVAAEELRKCPDGVLVDVKNDRETVRIVKDGNKFEVLFQRDVKVLIHKLKEA